MFTVGLEPTTLLSTSDPAKAHKLFNSKAKDFSSNTQPSEKLLVLRYLGHIAMNSSGPVFHEE
jgi:hypothetical protein